MNEYRGRKKTTTEGANPKCESQKMHAGVDMNKGDSISMWKACASQHEQG